MKFIITVDTEADNQWRGGEELSLKNLCSISRFQELCETYGFPPTYLVTYEVAVSHDGISILKPLQDSGRAEIGAHLHPWTTPPYFNEREEKRLMHFPSELSDTDLRNKFITLHEAITNSFGPPVSFRAGRWGYDARVGKLLKDFGYLVDCSVTPYVNWRQMIRGGMVRNVPDFMHASPIPVRDTLGFIEIPMTILPKDTAWISRMGARLLGRGSFRVRWCRIFPDTRVEDLYWIIDQAMRLQLPYLEFMIHSSELIVGGSPYTKTNAQLERLYVIFEQLLQTLTERGIKGVTLATAAKEFAALSTHFAEKVVGNK